MLCTAIKQGAINKLQLYYTEVFCESISASNKSSLNSDIVKEVDGNLRRAI